jgi:hypothetical protein
MGRRKSETPIRSEVIHVRLVPAGVQKLDEMRGEGTRSEFIRDLIKDEWERRKEPSWRRNSRELYAEPRETVPRETEIPETEPREIPENPWES